jgi:hypothetical protein
VINSDEALGNIQRQNDIIIGLLARMIWSPTQLADIVVKGKKRPDAYRKVYNALDGNTTGSSLAAVAGVTQQAISYVLQAWEEEGIVVNVGTDSPRYKRLMSIPTKSRKGKAGNDGEAE